MSVSGHSSPNDNGFKGSLFSPLGPGLLRLSPRKTRWGCLRSIHEAVIKMYNAFCPINSVFSDDTGLYVPSTEMIHLGSSQLGRLHHAPARREHSYANDINAEKNWDMLSLRAWMSI